MTKDPRNWKALGAACRANGTCPTCRKRKPTGKRKTCDVCIARATGRRAKWRKRGLCVDCRVKTPINKQTRRRKRRCPECNLVHQKHKRERRAKATP